MIAYSLALFLSLQFNALGLALANEKPQIGTLIQVDTSDPATSRWTCSTQNREVLLELNSQSQWIVVDIPNDARFSGVATKAAYKNGDSQMLSYSLRNDGYPYFYEFGFKQNLTKNQSTLTLKFGANELLCKSQH